MSLQRYTSLQPAADLPQLTAELERERPRSAGGAGGSRGWYSIKNLSEAETEVLIYDYIGYGGGSAGDFIRELSNIKSGKITLRVNSLGGDVFDGVAIFNAIKRHKAEVTAYVDGIAASAASFIVMAADDIVMSPHSQMMVHEAHGLCLGPADDMLKMAEALDKSSDNIARIYAGRAGGEVAEWRARMKDETWISDREAVAPGLADRVDGEDAEATKLAARLAQNGHRGAGGPENAEWTTAFINGLPDSAFAIILPGGEKDGEGRTTPRSLRKLPHHNAEGALDEPHLRNALSRESQTDMPDDAHAPPRAHLNPHAKDAGIGDLHDDNEPQPQAQPIDWGRLFDDTVEQVEDQVFA